MQHEDENGEVGYVRVSRRHAFVHIRRTILAEPDDLTTDFCLDSRAFYHLWKELPELILSSNSIFPNTHLCTVAIALARSVSFYLDEMITLSLSLADSPKLENFFSTLEHTLLPVLCYSRGLLHTLKSLKMFMPSCLLISLESGLERYKKHKEFSRLLRVHLTRSLLARYTLGPLDFLENPAANFFYSLRPILTNLQWERLMLQPHFPH